LATFHFGPENKFLIKYSISDPHRFYADPDPDPAFLLNADPDPDLDPDLDPTCRI
jgi:hypothetical protein